ncbi:MAG: hypothetical protein GF308_09465 [Candidatus Heimdallarchaeota archaeon]|nr:hypothetical protein [Candidatus Heimdallarchaeota archaeon]
MQKKVYVLLIGFSLAFSICFSSFLTTGELVVTEASDNPPAFFEISVLAPATCTMRNVYIERIVEELPKIGIGIDIFEETGWAGISPRTWAYPGPYPIPTYAEGGFDILFVGWSWELDWDPMGLFDTASWVPAGDNFYQYSNPLFDEALKNYYDQFLLENRIEHAEQMQEILYDDQPAITIYYPKSLLVMDEKVSGMDGVLWTAVYQPMEQWSVEEGSTELHYATPADFVDFHILFCESIFDAQWLRQIYNGLLERENGTREWMPRLATSYNSDDGINWTVEMDPDAKWGDGTPVTAEDVVFTYQAILNPALGSTRYSFTKKYFDNSSITALDNHTVQFVLKEPYAFAENLLAYDLIPKHIWEPIPYSHWWEQAQEWALNDSSKLIGTGPYRLKSWNDSQGIIYLEKNPYFAEMTGVEEPHLEDIFFEFYSNKGEALSALAEGTIDVVDAQFSPTLEEVTALPNVTYQLINDFCTQEMAINCQHPYLGTGELCPIPGNESAKYIRQAISHIVPREEIIEEFFEGRGRPSITPMPPGCLGADTTLEPYEYSIALAKDRMRAAGFVYPEDTSPSEVSISLGNRLSILMGIISLVGGCYSLLRLTRRKK